MTLLPVVARELRVASRRASSYWGRALAALVAIGVFAWVFLLERGANGTQMGTVLFGVIATLAYVFAALAGVVFSADSISSERREGTLGLLFLTDLRGADVALGKLTASSLAAIYGLLAIFPVLGLCLLMGGVTGAEYGRVILVLVVVLLTSLALGLLASTLANDPMRAAVTALALILLWQFGGPLAGILASLSLERFGWDRMGINALFEGWEWVTPVTAMTGAFAEEYKRHAKAFRNALAFCSGLGLASLVLASLRLPRIWQVAESTTRLGWAGWLKGLRFRSSAEWTRYRTRLLELHPVVWLSGRHWLRNALVWAFLAGGGLLYTLIAGLSGDDDWWQPGALFAVAFPAHAILKCWAALEAPRQFFSDRRSGALELLLTTPVTIPELLRGRLNTLKRQFLGPAIAVAVLESLAGLRLLLEHPSDGDVPLFLLLWAIHLTTLFADLWTIAWVGNWVGLSTNGSRSTLHVIARVLVLPWIIWLVGSVLISVGFAGAMRQASWSGINWAVVSLLTWFGLTVANNLFWLSRAQRGLREHFRDTAAGQVRQRGRADH